jgi:hypothetical protein
LKSLAEKTASSMNKNVIFKKYLNLLLIQNGRRGGLLIIPVKKYKK